MDRLGEANSRRKQLISPIGYEKSVVLTKDDVIGNEINENRSSGYF